MGIRNRRIGAHAIGHVTREEMDTAYADYTERRQETLISSR